MKVITADDMKAIDDFMETMGNIPGVAMVETYLSVEIKVSFHMGADRNQCTKGLHEVKRRVKNKFPNMDIDVEGR